MSLTLSKILPPTRSGRTFFVASSLLGLCAFLQLAFLGWYLAHGGARIAATAKSTAAAPVPATLPFRETMVPNVAPMDPPAPTPATIAVASDDPQNQYDILPGPTPAPVARLPGGVSGDALEQARALRQRGDMRAALSRLREALVAEPDNPQVIAELALTYEAMQLADKAAEQWQRIFTMGESVGALYYLADTKLHTVGNVPSSGDGAASRRTGGPSQVDRTVLKITSINAEEIPDPSVEQKVALKIIVKGLPGVVINPARVKIEAYFYDLLDGMDMVQTDAQTDFAWLSEQPINWADGKSEVLEALYVRPKGGVALMPGAPAISRNGASRRRNGRNDKTKPTPEPADSPAAADANAAPVRKYLGYSVRLYYNGQLQEVQADPVRLLERFQAPLSLPTEESAAPNNQGAPR